MDGWVVMIPPPPPLVDSPDEDRWAEGRRSQGRKRKKELELGFKWRDQWSVSLLIGSPGLLVLLEQDNYL